MYISTYRPRRLLKRMNRRRTFPPRLSPRRLPCRCPRRHRFDPSMNLGVKKEQQKLKQSHYICCGPFLVAFIHKIAIEEAVHCHFLGAASKSE